MKTIGIIICINLVVLYSGYCQEDLNVGNKQNLKNSMVIPQFGQTNIYGKKVTFEPGKLASGTDPASKTDNIMVLSDNVMGGYYYERNVRKPNPAIVVGTVLTTIGGLIFLTGVVASTLPRDHGYIQIQGTGAAIFLGFIFGAPIAAVGLSLMAFGNSQSTSNKSYRRKLR